MTAQTKEIIECPLLAGIGRSESTPQSSYSLMKEK